MQKGFAITYVLAGILILALVAGGAYYLGKESNRTSIYQTPVITPSGAIPTVSSPTRIQTDETERWKTYVNERYRYSFKYPPDWNLAQESDYHVQFLYSEGGKEYSMAVERGGRGGPQADEMKDVAYMVDGKTLLRRTWIKNNKPFFVSVMANDANFNWFNHIEITLPDTDTVKYLDLFDKILSTFKFS